MITSRCGIVCTNFTYRDEMNCGGCVNIENPFWGSCKIKTCCESRSLEHCGECSEFPCEALKDFSYDEKEGDNGLRIDQGKVWKASRHMKYFRIDDFLMGKAGVNRNMQQWNWIRYCLEDKMFAAVCLDDNDIPYYITLKLEPEEGSFLRSQYDDIIPGFYMNKTHWNSIKPNGKVSDEMMKDLLDKSYELVLSEFSKKKQQEITGIKIQK